MRTTLHLAKEVRRACDLGGIRELDFRIQINVTHQHFCDACRTLSTFKESGIPEFEYEDVRRTLSAHKCKTRKSALMVLRNRINEISKILEKFEKEGR